MNIWDLPGYPLCRRLWVHYVELPGVHGLVFIRDGSQPGTPDERLEFQNILINYNLRNTPLLLLVKNIDLPCCRSLSEIAGSFQLNTLENRFSHIQASSAITGEGIKDRLKELNKMVKYYKSGSCRAYRASR